jgi:hypothetical protein
MMLRVPVPDAPLDLAEKVEATILSQMTEVADQVCDGMLVSGATVLLKKRNCLGSPCNMIGFVRHVRFSMAPPVKMPTPSVASFLPQPHRLKCDHGCQENPRF